MSESNNLIDMKFDHRLPSPRKVRCYKIIIQDGGGRHLNFLD